MLPTVEFRALWEQMKAQFERDQAAVLMVEALYIAATYDQEQAVADYLCEALAKKQLTLRHLQQQFIPDAVATLPPIEAQQHSLDSYDQLLSCADDSDNNDSVQPDPPTGNKENGSCQQSLSTAQQPAQTAQAHQHAYPLGGDREPRFAAAMVLCAILTQLVPARSRPKRPDASQKSQKRSSTSRRKKFDQL